MTARREPDDSSLTAGFKETTESMLMLTRCYFNDCQLLRCGY